MNNYGHSLYSGGAPSSAKSWCSQYSQAFLAKTIETSSPLQPSMDDDAVTVHTDNDVRVVEEEEDPSDACLPSTNTGDVNRTNNSAR